jgi:hypothetical protein
LKKAAQKLSGIWASGVGDQKPQTQINKSFLLLFYKKAELPCPIINLQPVKK